MIDDYESGSVGGIIKGKGIEAVIIIIIISIIIIIRGTE
jgi:hypothetical protein